MQFSCDKSVMLEAVNTVSRAVPQKTSTPVLEGILMEVYEDGMIRMVGYDVSIGIEVRIHADVVQKGRVVVNAKKFGDILRVLDNDTVSFSSDEQLNLTILCNVAKYTLSCADPNLYPDLPMIEKDRVYQIRRDTLNDMLRRVLFAVSDSDTMPVLRGVLFHIGKEDLTLVSCDSNRLCLCKQAYTNEHQTEEKFVVPGKTLSELNKIMMSNDELVSISTESHRILFEFGNIKIVSVLINGDFINYEPLIQKNAKTKVQVSKEALKRSVERASVLCDEKIRNPVRFSFEFESVVVSCNTSTGNMFSDEINATIDGENIEIGFNHKYILDALTACDSETVEIGLNSPFAMVYMKNSDSDDTLFVIAPRRLNS